MSYDFLSYLFKNNFTEEKSVATNMISETHELPP